MATEAIKAMMELLYEVSPKLTDNETKQLMEYLQVINKNEEKIKKLKRKIKKMESQLTEIDA